MEGGGISSGGQERRFLQLYVDDHQGSVSFALAADSGGNTKVTANHTVRDLQTRVMGLAEVEAAA